MGICIMELPAALAQHIKELPAALAQHIMELPAALAQHIKSQHQTLSPGHSTALSRQVTPHITTCTMHTVQGAEAPRQATHSSMSLDLEPQVMGSVPCSSLLDSHLRGTLCGGVRV